MKYFREKVAYLERDIRDKLFDDIIKLTQTGKGNIKDVRVEAPISWSGHRADILIERKDGGYMIFEVKPCNRRVDRHAASSAIGQILLYRELLSQKRDVPKEKIELVIASDFFSDEVIQIIRECELPIELCLVGDKNNSQIKEETA